MNLYVNFPNGWINTTIGELILRLQYGYTASASNEVTGIKFLRITDIQNYSVNWNTVPYCEISKEDFDRYKLQEGDFVFARTGSIEKTWRVINAPPAVFASYLIRGKPVLTDIGDWLKYFLHSYSYLIQIGVAGAGIGRQNVNAQKLAHIEIPFAPLNEQRRIVAKIEALKARSQRVKEALEDIPQLLDQFRQSVLAAAFRGDLTADWREQNSNVEPASVLLERIRAERRQCWEYEVRRRGKEPQQANYKELKSITSDNLFDLPNTWTWVRVQEVGRVHLGRQRSPKNHSGEYMRPYLRAANVFEDRIDTSDIMEMNFNPEEYEIFKLKVGDILLNEGQSKELVGRPAIYRGEVPGSCFQNTLVRFQAYDGLLPEYALIVFRGYMHSGRFQQIAQWTTNIAHLGAGRFAEVEFPLPSETEQIEIVTRVKDKFASISRFESAYNSAINGLDQLDQSILAKAFRGELVPQDPNDEPASVLLEHIRAERAKLQTKTAKKSTTKTSAPHTKKTQPQEEKSVQLELELE